MTYELRIERQFDASSEAVFDAFADRTAQGVLHGAEQQGWNVEVIQTDVRVDGTSIVRMGPEGREPDTETRVYSVVDRPHRLELRYSMELAEELGPHGRYRHDGHVRASRRRHPPHHGRDGLRPQGKIATGSWKGGPSTLETLGRILKARHDT